MISNQEAEVFLKRREALLDRMPEHSVAILFACLESPRNNDTTYPFRQDSDFYYLTGVTEPEAVLLLIKEDNHSVLFSHKKVLSIEQWVGLRIGAEQAISHYHFDSAYPLESLEEKLAKYFKKAQSLLLNFQSFSLHSNKIFNCFQQLQSKVRQGVNLPRAIYNLNHILHEMRLKKSAVEIEKIKLACDISVAAHLAAMSGVKSCAYEYELEAILQHHFIKAGARQPAYESIVAAGDNACILHYTQNDAPLRSGELVLIDAGCEKNYYASDITRTFPINGHYTSPQKAIYELVWHAQSEALKRIKPGLPYSAIQKTVVRELTQGLIDLGILKGGLQDNIERKTYRSFYMHGAGHWLGLDVHDVGSYAIEETDRLLEPGMVLTVEPGLYFSQYGETVSTAYQSIGIRIEDDIVVTESGYENLSKALPSTIDEIEQIING